MYTFPRNILAFFSLGLAVKGLRVLESTRTVSGWRTGTKWEAEVFVCLARIAGSVSSTTTPSTEPPGIGFSAFWKPHAQSQQKRSRRPRIQFLYIRHNVWWGGHWKVKPWHGGFGCKRHKRFKLMCRFPIQKWDERKIVVAGDCFLKEEEEKRKKKKRRRRKAW